MKIIIILVFIPLELSYCFIRSMLVEQKIGLRGVAFQDYFHERFTTGLMQCTVQCVNEMDCKSFSYQSLKGVCRLHNKYFTNESFGIEDFTWNYYVCIMETCHKEGYELFPDQKICIKFFFVGLILREAMKFCKNDGARMITINSTSKNKLIRNYIDMLQDRQSYEYFIHLNGKYDRETNKWITDANKELSFFPWASDEPSQPAEHKYIRYSDKNNSLWETSTGYRARYFICEIDMS